ncbi:MAG: hypothetical protein U0231_01175 [Nitrospiraceae bacterium]
MALIRQGSMDRTESATLVQDGKTLKGGQDGDRFKLVVRNQL